MNYSINYEKDLNAAQLEAITFGEGPLLVIAGAGSGKTRTIIYRLARLLEGGVMPHNILLLTFTRKAAAEMTHRAAALLHSSASSHATRGEDDHEYVHLRPTSPHSPHSPSSPPYLGVRGGTFHSFAYGILRTTKLDDYKENVSLMDDADMLSALHLCKDQLKLGKGDKAFPKNQTILQLISKRRNLEQSLETVLKNEAIHLLPYIDDLTGMSEAYAKFKLEHSLLDYDDLLFELERLFVTQPDVLAREKERCRYIMVDEYQDTNRVQSRIVRLLAGQDGNILAVGDDAQSIYSFRGADIQNILDFPKLFPTAKVVTLEENYRSMQPILTLGNNILKCATQKYPKNLFTRQEGGELPVLMRPLSDMSQAALVADTIESMLAKYNPEDIAVLFRAGFHSFNLELELGRRGIAFRKYGGIKYSDAAHVKDVLALARLIVNPLDLPSFMRIAELFDGIGPKTAQKLYKAGSSGQKGELEKVGAKFKDFLTLLAEIAALRSASGSVQYTLESLLNLYFPILRTKYVDDYPYREQALEEMLTIGRSYKELDLFIADLSLESPETDAEHRGITLSTVHSAKGLEWEAVLIIDLVAGRFPSRHSMLKDSEFEEERRLFYVACTRAKKELLLFSPATLFKRELGGHEPVCLSPLLEELPKNCYDEIIEHYGGFLQKRQTPQYIKERQPAYTKDFAPFDSASGRPLSSRQKDRAPALRVNIAGQAGELEQTSESGQVVSQTVDQTEDQNEKIFTGYCTHKLFGRGKIVQHIPPDKYRINFLGFGLKVIMAPYLTFEE